MKPGMIRTEKELRSFCAHAMATCREGESLWLMSGDLDCFRDMNIVFGRTIMDTLLREGQKILIDELRCFERAHTLPGTAVLLVGDEVFFLFPPSRATEEEMRLCARQLAGALQARTFMRHLAFSLQGPHMAYQTFESWCPAALQQELSKNHIVMEGEKRLCGGTMVVGKVLEEGERMHAALRRIVQTIQSLCTGGVPMKASFRWLYNPGTRVFEHFNGGYVPSLSISLGLAGLKSGEGPEDPGAWTDVLFHQAGSSLRNSKNPGECLHGSASLEVTAFRSYDPHRVLSPIMGESGLRSLVQRLSKGGEKGSLVRIEFSYSLHDVPSFPAKRLGRGDGVCGLKGINQVLGHEYGDMLIRLLESVVYHTISTWCRGRGIPRRNVLIGRFIDSFTLYFTGKSVREKSLILLVHTMLHHCNSSLRGASVDVLTASVVHNSEKIDSSELFRRAELTLGTSNTRAVIHKSEHLAVKCYRHGIDREGMERIEEEAYYGALRLMSLQPAQAQGFSGLPRSG